MHKSHFTGWIGDLKPGYFYFRNPGLDPGVADRHQFLKEEIIISLKKFIYIKPGLPPNYKAELHCFAMIQK